MSEEPRAYSINCTKSKIDRLDEWCRDHNTNRSRVIGIMIDAFFNELDKKAHDLKKYSKELEKR